MPCESGPSYNQSLQEKQFKTIMTRLACDRCRELEKRGGVPDWAFEWWEHHKIEDAERIATNKKAREQEQIRRRAISKLTKEEREEVGV